MFREDKRKLLFFLAAKHQSLKPVKLAINFGVYYWALPYERPPNWRKTVIWKNEEKKHHIKNNHLTHSRIYTSLSEHSNPSFSAVRRPLIWERSIIDPKIFTGFRRHVFPPLTTQKLYIHEQQNRCSKPSRKTQKLKWARRRHPPASPFTTGVSGRAAPAARVAALARSTRARARARAR